MGKLIDFMTICVTICEVKRYAIIVSILVPGYTEWHFSLCSLSLHKYRLSRCHKPSHFNVVMTFTNYCHRLPASRDENTLITLAHTLPVSSSDKFSCNCQLQVHCVVAFSQHNVTVSWCHYECFMFVFFAIMSDKQIIIFNSIPAAWHFSAKWHMTKTGDTFCIG